MKTILLIALSILSSSVFAENIHDLPENHSLSTDSIVEMIWDVGYEFQSGDDGKECRSDVFNYSYLASNNESNFSISFTANQNGEFDYGCIAGNIPCTARFNLINNKWNAEVSCKLFQ